MADTPVWKDQAASVLAGVLLLVEEPLQVGDRISAAGYYGEVTSIGLRAIRLVTLDDNEVTIPNAKFLSEPVASGNFGALDMLVQTDFVVGTDRDLTRVIQPRVIGRKRPRVPAAALLLILAGCGYRRRARPARRRRRRDLGGRRRRAPRRPRRGARPVPRRRRRAAARRRRRTRRGRRSRRRPPGGAGPYGAVPPKGGCALIRVGVVWACSGGKKRR